MAKEKKGLFSGKKKEQEENKDILKVESVEKIRDSDFYLQVKPKSGYDYFGDYFIIDDDRYACVLVVQSNEGSDSRLAPFWGVQLAMQDLGEGFEDVDLRFISKVSRRSEAWVESHIESNERVVEGNAEEGANFNRGNKHVHEQKEGSFDEVSKELVSGESYLDVRLNYVLSAPSLEILDRAVQKLNYNLRIIFETVNVVARDATQRDDFTNLLRANEMVRDRRFGFTSVEYAGFANLVTQGINDLTGVYVGQMTGDINNSAVVFDINNYKRSVVIASDGKAETLSLEPSDIHPEEKVKGSDMWGVKLAQMALREGNRVVEFVLNDSDILNVGADLSRISAVVDMDNGDLNPFEFFGEKGEEVGLMSQMVNKLTLMIQLVGGIDLEAKNDESVTLKSELTKEIKRFYVDMGMWVPNPNDPMQKEGIRLVGLNHYEYPTLNKFVAYIRQRYKQLIRANVSETFRIKALNTLEGILTSMLEVNTDLFDVTTKDTIDSVSILPRMVYNFNSLRVRGTGVAMAQFANVLGFATRTLTEGDVVIFYGAEHITPEMRNYVASQIDEMYDRRVRVVFVYGNVSKMLSSAYFNQVGKADYTLIGTLDPHDLADYQQVMRVTINDALASVLNDHRDYIWYLRRSFENVVFGCDISIGSR